MAFKLTWYAVDGTDPADVMKIVHDYLGYGKRNKETVAELFVTLLVKVMSLPLSDNVPVPTKSQSFICQDQNPKKFYYNVPLVE